MGRRKTRHIIGTEVQSLSPLRMRGTAQFVTSSSTALSLSGVGIPLFGSIDSLLTPLLFTALFNFSSFFCSVLFLTVLSLFLFSLLFTVFSSL